jgi:hypothetical protein
VSTFRQGFFSRRGRRLSSFDYGPIAFDYGSRTHRFGAGLDVSEAKTVVRDIRRHYRF